MIFTSHDPDLIKLADKVVVLDEGSLVYAGPLEREPSSGLQSPPEQSLSQQPLSQELSQSKQGVANG